MALVTSKERYQKLETRDRSRLLKEMFEGRIAAYYRRLIAYIDHIDSKLSLRFPDAIQQLIEAINT